MKTAIKIRVLASALGALGSAAAQAADGVLDTTFGSGGVAYMALDGVEGHQLAPRAMSVQHDGRIVLGGWRNKIIAGTPDPRMRAMVARLRPDGSPDTTFGADPALPGLSV
ncbi:MAG TPA: delta-60 repeat domain-containing protein, partial [Tahibacter sp.]|nr:delta-60 repeat domain-containing protein [Tahibacter sp.]